MKDMSADAAVVTYINAADYSVLPNGDEFYAKSLATQLSGHDEKEIVSAGPRQLRKKIGVSSSAFSLRQ